MKSHVSINVIVLTLFLCLVIGLFLLDFQQPQPSPAVDPNDPNCVAKWAARLESPELCFEAQTELLQQKNALPMLIALMARDNPESRYQAVAMLPKTPPAWAAKALPNLERLLKDDDDEVRRVTIETLAYIGPAAKKVVPTLCELLHRKRTRPTRFIAEYKTPIPMALARIQGNEAIPLLVESLRIQPELTSEIIDALVHLSPASVTAISEIEEALKQQPHLRKTLELSLDHLYLQGTWRKLEIEYRDQNGATFTEVADPGEEWTINGDSWKKKDAGPSTGSGSWRIFMPEVKMMELVSQDIHNKALLFNYFCYQVDGNNLRTRIIEELASPKMRTSIPEIRQSIVEQWVCWRKVEP